MYNKFWICIIIKRIPANVLCKYFGSLLVKDKYSNWPNWRYVNFHS